MAVVSVEPSEFHFHPKTLQALDPYYIFKREDSFHYIFS